MLDEVVRQLYARGVYGSIVLVRGEGSVFRRLDRLRELEYASPATLAERQRRRVAEVVHYARERVPLYRNRWSGLQQFSDLPLLSKEDLQRHRDLLIADPGPRRITAKTTGGSTGQAVTVLKNRDATAAEMAATWLGYGWVGIRPGDRAARFWGSPTTTRRRVRMLGADLAMRRLTFSSFAFDENDLERYWKRCLGYRPRYLYGYVSMLEAFANHVARQGHDPAALGLRAIVTTSEVLAPTQRRLIAGVFGVPVQNEYGCGEMGPIAYSCEKDSLHVMSESVLAEVLDPSGAPVAAGETGELVLTDLNNRAMPLVRYRVGDLAVQALGSCSCGRGFPTLDRVWGRAYDFVDGPDKKRYHGEFFMYLFEDLRASGFPVEQFQVVQVGVDRLIVRLVASPAAETVVAVQNAFASRLPAMKVTMEFVESVPRSPSGKLRLIENRLAKSNAPTAETV
jgi:phenylacetate-CoA ligase